MPKTDRSHTRQRPIRRETAGLRAGTPEDDNFRIHKSVDGDRLPNALYQIFGVKPQSTAVAGDLDSHEKIGWIDSLDAERCSILGFHNAKLFVLCPLASLMRVA